MNDWVPLEMQNVSCHSILSGIYRVSFYILQFQTLCPGMGCQSPWMNWEHAYRCWLLTLEIRETILLLVREEGVCLGTLPLGLFPQ